ncbi:hypothetical protein BDV37DRAFT_159923 [Aspergillus pseudonomiae]|uniref:Uncharacterized protein n=1 Tax=Aspergillus pseudonomiae TaxID=1506151 RepID=A0A5N7D7W8_9EURO|nr:uncharacterized protein BDV37DRAFT_159923 [Aspergillus pseudonomiae]KAE8402511.1 hypothetical protein BDV37DRAFT_159923 [Aspergillus pseudonomiae]
MNAICQRIVHIRPFKFTESSQRIILALPFTALPLLLLIPHIVASHFRAGHFRAIF